MRTHDTVLIGLAAAATAVMGYVAVMAATPGSDKQNFVDPVAGWSDEQKQALVDQTHRRELDFVEEFVKSKRDPRSLPKAPIESSYVLLPKSIEESVELTSLVVRGRVTRVTYEGFDDGRLPHSLAEVQTIATIKGRHVSSITVMQLGGPVPGGADGKGVLMYLDADELLLPGDEVILLLNEGGDGTWSPQAATGIYSVRDGRIATQALNPFGADVVGSATDRLMGRLVAAASP